MADIEKEVQEVVERLKELDIDIEPEEVRRFYVDNIISRSFSYLFGWDKGRPRKIEASSEGAIKVASTGIAAPEEIKNDQVTIGTTATALAPSSVPVVRVTVQSLPENGNDIGLGHSTDVTLSNGYILTPGDTKTIKIDDVSKIYVIAGAAGQTITYLGEL